MKNKVLLLTLLFLMAPSSFAQDNSIQNINLNSQSINENSENQIMIDLNKTQDNEVKIILSDSDRLKLFLNASDKFVQSNIRASYSDFKVLIETVNPSDFTYLCIAEKMANFGFYDLANIAISKVADPNISRVHVEDIRRFYFPRKKLDVKNELLLAETYSNITYNDQASEAVSELLKNSAILKNSDYANFLIALGSYKSNNLSQAKRYIDIAILQNPVNLNYKNLKAEILAENKNTQDALKTVEYLKRQHLVSYEFVRKINSLEQFVLYKTAKEETLKNYYLGYYYYYENDPQKAQRTLNSAISSNKKLNGKIYSVLGKIYLQILEEEKAEDCIKKASRIDNNNYINLINQGDLKLQKNDLKGAFKFYQKAENNDRYPMEAMIKKGEILVKMNKTDKAKEVFTKVLKLSSKEYKAYYDMALLDKVKEITYLKKTVGINLMYKDAWLELANIYIQKDDVETADKYLKNAYYLDENDFRYYYYKGLICKKQNDISGAEYNFKKSLKLNGNFEQAKKELAL